MYLISRLFDIRAFIIQTLSRRGFQIDPIPRLVHGEHSTDPYRRFPSDEAIATVGLIPKEHKISVINVGEGLS